MKVLGIDPGTTRIGYGFIEGTKCPILLTYGVLKIQAQENPARLAELADRFEKLLDELKPDLAGVERLYFSKNQKTALPVSEARGVILMCLTRRGIPLREWQPQQVKLAVTDYGLADKKAVAIMIKRILGVAALKGYDDASDALAVAVTTAFHAGPFG